MADINGTNVASKIVPYTTADEYATHDEQYGVGGYRTVDSVSEMNAIPAARRKEGMLVNVKGDKIYKLNSSNTFVDAGLGGSIYKVDTTILDFSIISDGDGIDTPVFEEIAKIVSAWSSGQIVLYIPSTSDPAFIYAGVLDITIIDSSIIFSIPTDSNITLYAFNLSTNVWSVSIVSNSGGGGSSNVKVLTTPDLFAQGRSSSIKLNASDCAVINSLSHNNYKNIQLYYVGAPSGDDGIYPVNIAGNSLGGTLSEGDTIYTSITTDTGTPIMEPLDYQDSTTIYTRAAPTINTTLVFSASNLSQNGYVKFQNGLMLQWGTRAGATNGAINLYFPQSFYNTDYNIYFTGAVNNTSESFIYAPGYDLNGKYTSYCRVLTRGINSTPAIVWTRWNFTWFAIGRWK